jgi:hypothetical protein
METLKDVMDQVLISIKKKMIEYDALYIKAHIENDRINGETYML